MKPLSPALLIAAASAYVGMREDDHDRGRMIRQFLDSVRLPAYAPWSAAFIHHVGHWSHRELKSGHSSWPLPTTGRCSELAEFAESRSVLSAEGPREGEVYL